MRNLRKPKGTPVRILVLAEWSEHSDGELHIDKLIGLVRAVCAEIKKGKTFRFSTQAARVQKINLSVSSFIPERVIDAISHAHIIVADLTSLRPKQKYNVNVAYEIGIAQAFRSLQQAKAKAKPNSKPQMPITPVPFIIVPEKKFRTTRADFSDFSGIVLGQYDLGNGLTTHSAASLKRIVNQLLRKLNIKYYNK